MLAKYLDPACVKPLYLLKDKRAACKCGRLTGVVYAAIFTLIIVLILIQKHKISFSHPFVYAIIIVISSLWILLPYTFQYGYSNLWKGFQDLISDLVNSGYSQDRATDIAGQIYNNQLSESTSGPVAAAGTLLLSNASSASHFMASS